MMYNLFVPFGLFEVVWMTSRKGCFKLLFFHGPFCQLKQGDESPNLIYGPPIWTCIYKYSGFIFFYTEHGLPENSLWKFKESVDSYLRTHVLGASWSFRHLIKNTLRDLFIPTVIYFHTLSKLVARNNT